MQKTKQDDKKNTSKNFTKYIKKKTQTNQNKNKNKITQHNNTKYNKTK